MQATSQAASFNYIVSLGEAVPIRSICYTRQNSLLSRNRKEKDRTHHFVEYASHLSSISSKPLHFFIHWTSREVNYEAEADRRRFPDLNNFYIL